MIPGRINPLKTMLMINDPMTGNIDEFCTSDDTVVMGLQAGTHWDLLAHATYSNRLYNGKPISSLTTKGRRRAAASTRSARWFREASCSTSPAPKAWTSSSPATSSPQPTLTKPLSSAR